MIKLRAWHPSWGEMIYSNGYQMLEKREWSPICFDIGFSGYPHDLNDDRTIVMLFSGLKDRNDVDIYEGDIVNLLGNIAVVNVTTHYGLRFTWGDYLVTIALAAGKVIGNIYEVKEDDNGKE